MNTIVKIVYFIKTKIPIVYFIMDLIKKAYVSLMYSSLIKHALKLAYIKGSIDNKSAVIRSIDLRDVEALQNMLKEIPAKSFDFFKPHKFDFKSIRKVLKSNDIMTYGLFIEKEMKGYFLLKLFPVKKAYIGRLLVPELSGKGVGAFVSKFLYWQCFLLGFKPYATINKNNISSLKSHEKVRPYKIEKSLSDNYMLISFALTNQDIKPPILKI